MDELGSGMLVAQLALPVQWSGRRKSKIEE
jgi:hypothetical protein